MAPMSLAAMTTAPTTVCLLLFIFAIICFIHEQFYCIIYLQQCTGYRFFLVYSGGSGHVCTVTTTPYHNVVFISKTRLISLHLEGRGLCHVWVELDVVLAHDLLLCLLSLISLIFSLSLVKNSYGFPNRYFNPIIEQFLPDKYGVGSLLQDFNGMHLH